MIAAIDSSTKARSWLFESSGPPRQPLSGCWEGAQRAPDDALHDDRSAGIRTAAGVNGARSDGPLWLVRVRDGAVDTVPGIDECFASDPVQVVDPQLVPCSGSGNDERDHGQPVVGVKLMDVVGAVAER